MASQDFIKVVINDDGQRGFAVGIYDTLFPTLKDGSFIAFGVYRRRLAGEVGPGGP